MRFIIIFEDDYIWETDAEDLSEAETKAYHFTNARIESIFEKVSDGEATPERA